jgi:Tol biopolymer transport system component
VRKLYGLSVLLCAGLAAVGPATASFPGGAGRILFQRTVKRNVDLYTMSAAGKSRRRLTKVTAADKWPAWSASGRRIAFTRSSRNGDAVWVMSSVGTHVVRVAQNAWDPTWSPDGSQIAFASDRTGTDDVFVMSLPGGQATNVTLAESSELDPSWSPDGTKIAFASSRNDPSGETYDLYVVNVDGTGLMQLTNGPEDDAVPNWSPDGTRIAFVRGTGEGVNVWVMNADGTDAHQITSGNNDYDPAWAPNGARIAFASYRQGRTGEIYVVNADGSALRRLTRDTVDDQSPDWQPLPVVP